MGVYGRYAKVRCVREFPCAQDVTAASTSKAPVCCFVLISLVVENSGKVNAVTMESESNLDEVTTRWNLSREDRLLPVPVHYRLQGAVLNRPASTLSL